MSLLYGVLVATCNLRKKKVLFNRLFFSDIANTVSTCSNIEIGAFASKHMGIVRVCFFWQLSSVRFTQVRVRA
jgi:hypothetical protein